MLFRDKPLSVIYIEECLINPPVYPGTLSELDYLQEIHYESMAGVKSVEEISEIVGEVWGTFCVRIVIGSCITGYFSAKGSKSEARSLEKTLEKLLMKQKNLLNHSPGNLNMTMVAYGAAKNFDYLIGGIQPNTIMQSELNVGQHIRDVRYEALAAFAPSRLRKSLYDGIESVTGVRPTD